MIVAVSTGGYECPAMMGASLTLSGAYVRGCMTAVVTSVLKAVLASCGVHVSLVVVGEYMWGAQCRPQAKI